MYIVVFEFTQDVTRAYVEVINVISGINVAG